jgi:hypothetical protein
VAGFVVVATLIQYVVGLAKRLMEAPVPQKRHEVS